jgi:tRNA nucleotidyltransferase (CCA-adding enzyme)
MQEKKFVEKINSLQGKVYVVGGWVRDLLRGAVPKDKDYVITGVREEDFTQVFPEALKVGKSFPVYLLEVDGEACEVAFARQERKIGAGYKGFQVFFDKSISISEDLYRRDTTMNSMAIDVATNELIDPFGGKEHIAERKIVATSGHFKDDPIRALRAARQAAQFGFSVAEATLALMKECRVELKNEPKERLFNELEQALAADKPSGYFWVLKQADLLSVTYPELYALIGQTQPVLYHPEGDAFNHTMEVVDRTAALNPRVEVRFAALVHDLGKGLTPKEKLPAHHGHDKAGVEALAAFSQHVALPSKWLSSAKFAILHHMRVTTLQKSGKIVDFILALAQNPLGAQGLLDIVKADKGGAPDCLVRFADYFQILKAVDGNSAPSHLKGRQIGEWLRQERIRAYGKIVKYVAKDSRKL